MPLAMRQILLTLTLLPALLMPAQAQELARSVTVSAQGYIEAVPDTLELTVSARETQKTMDEARKRVDATIASVLAVAKQQGIAEDDINASRVSAQPEYEWRSQERHYLGETVQRDVVLKLRELDKYGTLVKALSALALHQIQGPRLSHSKQDALQLAALKVALARGTEKARLIAGEVGATLGPVISVTEGSAQRPQPRMMMAEAMSADSGAEGGYSYAKERISARVEMRFGLR
jgi:uncharacterized protein YggE